MWFSIPTREEVPSLTFLLITILLSTTCFVLSVFATLSCDFVKRSVQLDPDVRYVLPFELEQRLVYHDLAGFTGIGMGFWSYTAWGGEHQGQGQCYPYHLCFLDGSYSEPPKNAGIGSARTFAVLANIFGGVGMSFLWFAAIFRLSPLRYTRPFGSVLWMACLCQAWTLVLMTRSIVCGPDFFSYCLPQSYQADEFAENSKCSLEQGAKLAISSTVLWFFTAVLMCVRPWFDCLLGDKGARVAQDDYWDRSNSGRGSARGRERRRSRSSDTALARFAEAAEREEKREKQQQQKRRSRSSDSALARFAAAAEAAEREEERERKISDRAKASNDSSRHKSYQERRRSRSSDSAMEKLARMAEIEIEDDLEAQQRRRKSQPLTEKSWGV